MKASQMKYIHLAYIKDKIEYRYFLGILNNKQLKIARKLKNIISVRKHIKVISKQDGKI